jgi:hypothetical protein
LAVKIGVDCNLSLVTALLLVGINAGAARAAAENSLQACLNSAAAIHNQAHAAACKHRADQTQKDHDDCLHKLKLPPAYCDASYSARDASPNCTLPDQVATFIDAALAQARNHCLRDHRADE